MELLYYCNPIPDYSTFMEHAPFINVFSISYHKGLSVLQFLFYRWTNRSSERVNGLQILEEK